MAKVEKDTYYVIVEKNRFLSGDPAPFLSRGVRFEFSSIPNFFKTINLAKVRLGDYNHRKTLNKLWSDYEFQIREFCIRPLTSLVGKDV